jgi:hypothetical protein
MRCGRADVVAGWDGFDVPALWQRVEPYGEGGAAAASMGRQVDAWRRFRDLTDDQARRIAAYREQVVTAWPPDKSPAAAAFIAHLDRLVAAMQEASGQAGQTAAGLDGVRNSLIVARGQVETVYREWRQRQSQNAATSGGSRLPVMPSHDWKQDLNRQAREAMGRMEQALADYQGHMTPPTTYRVNFGAGLVIPQDESASATPSSDHLDGSSSSMAGNHAPAEMPGSDQGPSLSGGQSTVNTPPLHAGPDVNPAAGGVPIGVTSPIVGFGPGSSAGGHASGFGRSGPVIFGEAEGHGPTTGRYRRGLPPGGVIEPARAGSAPLAARSDAVAGEAHSPVSGSLLGGGAAGRQRRSIPGNNPAPYVEWTVAEGVPPILAAKPEVRRHDPGPNVIGIDR